MTYLRFSPAVSFRFISYFIHNSGKMNKHTAKILSLECSGHTKYVRFVVTQFTKVCR